MSGLSDSITLHARLHALMRLNTPKRPGTKMHARTHAHAHTDQYVTVIAFPRQQ